MMIIRDEYSRFTKVYLLHSKDAAEYYMKYLVATAPRKVKLVRAMGGGVV